MIHIDIQHGCETPAPVPDSTLSEWVECALAPHQNQAELTLRIVDAHEITHLNKTYRKQNKATNVLSFPSNLPENIRMEYPLLGDVIICPAVLKEESHQLNTPLIAHWAHIVVHGVLHLLGYDHIHDADARIMETLEIETLAKLGFNDPYCREDTPLD